MRSEGGRAVKKVQRHSSVSVEAAGLGAAFECLILPPRLPLVPARRLVLLLVASSALFLPVDKHARQALSLSLFSNLSRPPRRFVGCVCGCLLISLACRVVLVRVPAARPTQPLIFD